MSTTTDTNDQVGPPDDDLRARLDFDDARLLIECEVHTFRASGPGGQHRNKTSSAVRLCHLPSGLSAKGAESRSQHQNKARALRRLREAIAVNVRRPLPDTIAWPENVRIVDGRLKLSRENPSTHYVIALALDALSACGGRLADAAKCLGVSSSSLTRFLLEHHAAWAQANRIRAAAGLPALRA